MAIDLSALDNVSFDDDPGGRAGIAALASWRLFDEDPENPRFEFSRVAHDALVEDIKERGVLQPLIVTKTSDERLKIRFGARRFRAAVAAGLDLIPYIVTEDARQFDGYAQVAENEKRAPLQPLEIAKFIAGRLRCGESQSGVARQLGMHRSAVLKLMSLVDDPPAWLLEAYHSGKCRSPCYLYRLRLCWNKQPMLVEKACADADRIDARFISHLADQCDDRPPDPAPTGTALREARGTLSDDGEWAATPRPTSTALPGLRGDTHSKPRQSVKLFGVMAGREVVLVLRPSSQDGNGFFRDTESGNLLEADFNSVTFTRVGV